MDVQNDAQSYSSVRDLHLLYCFSEGSNINEIINERGIKENEEKSM